VFNPADLPPIPTSVLWVGVAAFAGALSVGVYLTLRGGWPILAFAVLGGLAAIFYEAPPIRWSYRGLGELVIGLAYGPWMVLGSLYLQTQAVSSAALAASLVPGLLIMALAVVNAIPDYHQDLLVGKRNLVVRVGRRHAVRLYLTLAAAGLGIVVVGTALGLFPASCLIALVAVPFLIASARRAAGTYETPRLFLPAVRSIVTCYAVGVTLFALGIALQGWRAP
jgi:1,4-dihydroxy-2-naphthoate octaprenyltransferase